MGSNRGTTSNRDMTTSGALNTAPRMKATVRFRVRNEATMPTESMASPSNQ